MDFFDNLRDKVTDLAQSGVAKSRQLAEIAKLKTANLGEEDAIKKAYIEIGKLYYAERGMAPDAAYAALCEKITAAKINIEENKNRVTELKGDVGIGDESDEEETPEKIIVLPEEPEVTEEPTTPEEPTVPEEPVAPETPEIPVTPEAPKAPEVPVEPLHQDDL